MLVGVPIEEIPVRLWLNDLPTKSDKPTQARQLLVQLSQLLAGVHVQTILSARAI